MPELTDAHRDLEVLAAELRRLEAEYNMFFAGRLPRPPWETRSRVAAIIKRLDRGYIPTAADRFRFSTLQSRFSTFADLWDRGMRAREEGRPGPFSQPQAPPKAATQAAGDGVVHLTAFSDPMRELDKVHALYDSLMDARRTAGEEVVPFHRFVGLVRGQVERLRERGSAEVAFRVSVKDGKVQFTARGLKGKA